MTQPNPSALVDQSVREAGTVDDAKGESLWMGAWRRLRTNVAFLIGLAIVVAFLLLALVAPWVAPHDPIAGVMLDSVTPSTPIPEAAPGHPLGGDNSGRDLLSRLIVGSQQTLMVGVLATAGGLLGGLVLGTLAGAFGGWVDAVLSRILDTFLAIPLLLAGIVVMSMVEHIDLPGFGWLGRNIPTVALMLTIFGWTSVARIMRGSVLQAKQADYVTAARSMGASTGRIIVNHIIPNAIAPVIVIATISLGMFIVAEATPSYLGIGLDTEKVVSWGGDISEAQRVLRTNPEIMVWPSLALSLCVLSFMLLGDAVRDALDPKARTR